MKYEWWRRTGFPRGSPTPVLAGTQAGLSSVFGMGTGGTPPLWPPYADRRNRTAATTRDVVSRALESIQDTSIGGYAVSTCSPACAWTRFRAPDPNAVSVMSVWLDRLVLAGSTPRCLGAYTPSLSNSSSTSGLGWYLFFKWVSSLDAFSSYPVVRRCPARALSNNRYTSGTHS